MSQLTQSDIDKLERLAARISNSMHMELESNRAKQICSNVKELLKEAKEYIHDAIERDYGEK